MPRGTYLAGRMRLVRKDGGLTPYMMVIAAFGRSRKFFFAEVFIWLAPLSSGVQGNLTINGKIYRSANSTTTLPLNPHSH